MRTRLTRQLAQTTLVTAIALAALAAPAAAQTTDALPEAAAQQVRELLADKQQRTPAQQKISSHLLYGAKVKLGLPITENVKSLMSPLSSRDDGRVDVDIIGDKTAALSELILNNGGLIPNPTTTGRVTRAAVPFDMLERIAALAEVRAIQPALRATVHSPSSSRSPNLARDLRGALERAHRAEGAPNTARAHTSLITPGAGPGSVLSEGVKAMDADRARKWFAVDGTGIKIGVISDSDDFKEQAIASGDLPADTFTIPGQSGRPGSGEGTAMMEIVHDVAPGAALFFASAFNSPESFADNIRALRFTYGCDVIVDDVQYFFESPYEDDIVAQAVIDVTNDGASYFSSAGNDGNLDDGTSGVWEGDFKKAKSGLSTLPAGYEVHDFGKGVISNPVTVSSDPLYLHWSDPSSLDTPQSSNDYDLFVLDADLRNVLIASTDIQDGAGLPFEFIDATIPVGARIVIVRKVGAADRAVRVQLSGGSLGLATDGANYGHSAVTAAFAVGAANVAEANGGVFAGGATTPVELFSSDGPRIIFYDPSGAPLSGTVTFKGAGGDTRKKPDLTAPDGVSTTLPGTSGLNPFFGTSAAAPHAAAVAGLLKAAKPDITVEKLRNALTKNATDIEAVGRDRDAGFGIVNAFNALTFIKATPSVFLDAGVTTVTPTTGDSDAFVEPGESANLQVNLINNGGAQALNLKGTITTSTPGVTITTPTASWPPLASGANGTNAVPLSFSVAPTNMCGAPANFTLTTTYSGPISPQTFAISVPVGQPSTTPNDVPYAGARVPIPDGNATGVDIPLTVSGATVISDVAFTIGGTTCTATQGATTVGLDHSWVGDLTLTLTSPSGTTVTLMNRPGGINNSGNNFCKTVLTDSATNSIQTIAIAGAPWQGSFKPAQPMAAFAGENPNGTWILHVTDSVTIDTGSVRAFTLSLKGYTCDAVMTP